MEEISFKPSIKPNIIIYLGFLALVSIILFIIGLVQYFMYSQGRIEFEVFSSFIVGLVIFGGFAFLYSTIQFVFSLISKLPLTYTLTSENEIVIEYSFLNKSTKVFRLDQITSVDIYRSFIDKYLGVGTVLFGVFGHKTLQQDSGNSGRVSVSTALLSLTEFEDIFNRISKEIIPKKSSSVSIDTKNPKTTPIKFNLLILSISIFLVALGSIFIGNVLVLLVALPFVLLFLVYWVSYFRLKKTSFTLHDTYLQIKHDYFFSYNNYYLPYKKLTNVNSHRGFIHYGFFKTESINLFTGGDRDPFLRFVPADLEYVNVFSYLQRDESSYLTQDDFVSLTKENLSFEDKLDNLNQTSKRVEVKSKSKEKPLAVERAGVSLYVTSILTSIFFILIAVLATVVLVVSFVVQSQNSLNFSLEIFFLILFILAFTILLKIIFDYFYWKSHRYEFYENKIVSVRGVFSLKRKEIHFRNLKYVSVRSPFLTRHLFGQGDIHLFTAGSDFEDNELTAIPNAKYYFAEIYSRLLDENEEKN